MLRTVVFLFAGAAAFLSARAEEDSARILRDIPYYPESAYTNDFMSRYARLDLRLPAGATNFATVVTFHGGGLVRGFRGDFFKVRGRDDIACVSAGYRLLTNATPSECVGDAAAAVAWTLKHIAEYGGDPKKVFVTGYSGGGYLTLMVGMNPKWLKPHGYRPQQLAGLFPSTGQTSTHFTIRKMTGDDTPTYITKVDEWAPLAYAARDLPPILLMTGENELDIPCRAEENRLLYASLKALGHPDVEQHAFWGRQHNNVWADTGFYQEDFVRRLSRAIDGRTYSGGPNRVRAVLEKARSVPGLETDFVSLVSSPAYELSATCVMARGNRADRPGDGDAFARIFETHPALLKELGMFKTRQRKGKDDTSHWETTATDLVRLAQMIAHRGEWHGRRLMSEADCAREFPLPYAFRSRLFAEADGSCGVLFPLKAVQDAALEPLAADWRKELQK